MTRARVRTTAPADTAADAATAAAPPPEPLAGNPILAGFLLAHADDPAQLGAVMFVYACAVVALRRAIGADAEVQDGATLHPA